MGIISPWRVAAGLKSYVGVVSGDTVLPVEWGFGRMEKDEGPITCGSVSFTREMWMFMETVW